MEFNYNKLRGKIREVFGSEARFCDKMPFNRSTLSQKLNGITEFNQSEMLIAMELLGIPTSRCDEYFFVVKA